MRSQLHYYQQQLIEYASELYADDPHVQTTFKPLSFYISEQPTEKLAILYEPSICVILQGEKEVEYQQQNVRYTPEHYLLSSVHTPAKVRITEATSERPYVGFTLTFTLEQIYEVLKELEDDANASSEKSGLYFGEMDIKLLAAVVRLVESLESEQAKKVLAPLYVKEVLFWLLQSEGGQFIRHYMKEGSTSQKVVQAITEIKANFTEKLNVKELAERVAMSESSFYSLFKKITTMSPLQFQKTLRLQEARQLLTLQQMSVSDAAFNVGYESASQFSREYSRMFGRSPKNDAESAMAV